MTICCDGYPSAIRRINSTTNGLMADFEAATSTGANMIAARLELDISDHLDAGGCPSPETALVASLLLSPEYIDDVAEILPKASALENEEQRRLYAAMLALRDERRGDLAQWWKDITESSGVSLASVIGYITYEAYRSTHAVEYAAQIFARAAQEFLVSICDRAVKTGGLAGIDNAISDLSALRARIMQASKGLIGE